MSSSQSPVSRESKSIVAVIFTLLMSLCLSPFLVQADEVDESLVATLSEFKKANFKKKAQVISKLNALEDERVLQVFQVMLEGRLYYEKKGVRFVDLNKQDDAYQARDLVSGEAFSEVKKRAYKKVSVNNKLRRLLRASIAGLQLSSPDLDTRMAAIRAMLKSDDQQNIPVIDQAISSELDTNAQELLSVAKAMLVARYGETSNRVKAIGRLEGELYPEVRSLLSSFLIQNEDGSYLEPAAEVRAAAAAALESIEDLVALNKLLENIYFGVSSGAVLLLAAIGLAITFGVMGVINMAHGEMIMLGAYTTYVIQTLMPDNIGASLIVAIPAAFLVAGLVGVIIERSVIRFLYGRPLETLLATFGISLILQQAVRTRFGALNKPVSTPEWMAGSFEVNGALVLTYNRLYIIIFSILVLVALALLLRKTFFGLQMRAVTQNRRMASSMGIRTGWLDAMTFGLGSGIAGIAGVALSQLTNVGPNLGQSYIIDSFMVVVFGGVGNLVGTFVGAMSLGVANKFLEPFSGAVLAKILVLIFIILFIQKYPRGMFALKGRAAGD